MSRVSRTRKQKTKGPVETDAQQTPCKDSCQDATVTAPSMLGKIALGISLTMLLAWIIFLAVLAFGK